MKLINELRKFFRLRRLHSTWSTYDGQLYIDDMRAMAQEAMERHEAQGDTYSLRYRVYQALRDKSHAGCFARMGPIGARPQRYVWNKYADPQLDREGYERIVFEITEHWRPYPHRQVEAVGLCSKRYLTSFADYSDVFLFEDINDPCHDDPD